MVSLAIWIAAALFLAYVGFVVLGLLAGMLKAAFRSHGMPARKPSVRPFWVRTKRDKVAAIGIVIATLIMVAIFVGLYWTAR